MSKRTPSNNNTSLAKFRPLRRNALTYFNDTNSFFGLWSTAPYLGIVTVLAAVGMLITVLLLMVYHNEVDLNDSRSVSSGCILLIARVAASCICSSKRHRFGRRCSTKIVTVVPVNGHESATGKQSRVSAGGSKESATEKDASVTWQDVAIILDRFVFIIFLTVTVAINVGFPVGLVVCGNTTDQL
ncbi:hypothetical protein DPMN_145203 [Dreissena polymorpha]|uniref:Uncharacterized protein n=1 Tax=Dreissena polymorpha TaxID=45954 RepID=A0A9D4F5K3_DREPO|nr:hypothetical protein DPMN_145203 [Dreissena polymorpha]